MGRTVTGTAHYVEGVGVEQETQALAAAHARMEGQAVYFGEQVDPRTVTWRVLRRQNRSGEWLIVVTGRAREQ